MPMHRDSTVRRRATLALAVLVAGANIAILWDPFIGAFIHRNRNRAEVRALFDAVAPGMTRETVARELASGKYPHLAANGGESGAYVVRTPLEFGAGNWILWIEFDSERVRALRMRTADGVHDHPAAAPPDRVLPGQNGAELVVSVGHAGTPSRAAFGQGHLATASSSNVALVDLSSGLTIGRLAHGGLVLSLEMNPAGDVLAVGTCDHAIQLWDVKSRTLLRRIPLTQECAESLSFSPDGALLAAGVYGCCKSGGGVQIYHVRDGALAREIGKGTPVRAVLFGRTGRWVIGVDDKDTAHVFEWPSGRELRTFTGVVGAGGSDAAATGSPDGRYFATVGKHQIKAWDVSTGAAVPLPGAQTVTISDRLPGGPERTWTELQVSASTAAFLDDGRLAYVDGSRLLTLTLPDGTPHETPLRHSPIESFGRSWLQIRRDGTMLAGAFDSRTVVWDVPGMKVRELTAPALTDPRALEWSRSGIIAWADYQSGVRAWSHRDGEPVALGANVGSASTLAFDPAGERLAVTDTSSIEILDVLRRRSVRSSTFDATETGVAFSPDGARLVFTASDRLALFTRTFRQLRVLATMEKYTSAEHVRFSPDGRWIAAGLGGPEPALRVWPSDASADAVTLDRTDVTYGPQPPAFSSDSRRLATFVKGDSLTIWTTATWKLERAWHLAGTGRALAFAPHGTRLAVAADGEAGIWDADTGRRLIAFTSPGTTQAREIAWSPDGTRVVTAADDGVLRFWRAEDGRLLASLFTLASTQDWLLAAPDGRVDGTDRALTELVAWRIGNRVALDTAQTARQRVRGLWRALLSSARDP